MSENIVLGIISVIGTCFTAFLAFLINAKATKIHMLVNGSYVTSLRVGYTALKKIADNSKREEDVCAAEAAKKLLDEYVAKQALLEKKEHYKLS